ncbi:nuclear transport factor 2 family protein [Undibacterium sp. Dicai25W]|uniref:nuclear transport factor 2 family protein n=1 Tax=Undibacterium sp. Dicai25W TaxID=3413034 RepID=UPI003BF0776C
MTQAVTQLAKQLISAFENKDIHAVADILADDIVLEDVPMADKHKGKSNVVGKISDLFGKIQYYKWDLNDIIVDGKKVVVERISQLAFGDKNVSLPMLVILEFNDSGKLIKFKDYFDLKTLEKQLA